MCVVVLLSLTSAASEAAELPSEMEGHGVRIGDVQVFPALDVVEQFDSNIAKSAHSLFSRPVSSQITQIKPSLNGITGSRRNYIGVQYKGDYGWFWSSRVDDYTDHFLDAYSHNEFSRRARMDVALNYTRSHDRRGATFTGILARLLGLNDPDRWHQMSAIAAFEYGREEARMRLSANASYAAKRYDNNRLFTRSQDVDNAIVGGTLYYRVKSRLYSLFEARYSLLDYRLASSALDSRELTLSSGITWEATAKTTGMIKAGWRHRVFSLSHATDSGLSWDATVEWRPMTYSTWEVHSAYSTAEAVGAAGSFVQTLRNEVKWTHDWKGAFRHELGAAVGRDRYIGTTRVDNLTDLGVKLTYALKRWLEVSGEYVYSRRLSNLLLSSYKQQLFSMAVHVEL